MEQLKNLTKGQKVRLLRFTGLLYVVLLMGAPLLFIWLLGVRSLRNVYLKQRIREED